MSNTALITYSRFGVATYTIADKSSDGESA